MIYKKKAHAIYKSTHTDVAYEHFARLRTAVKSYTTKLHDAYLSRIESSIAGDTKSFFNYVNHLKTSKTLPDNMPLDQIPATTPQVKADLFATYFASVFVPGSPMADIDFEPYSESASDLSVIEISVEKLFDNLCKLDVNGIRTK